MSAKTEQLETSFDTEYNKLVAIAPTADFSDTQSLAISCMQHLDRKNADLLCAQMQKLHYAMWLNPEHCGPILLANMFSPYMGRNPDQTIPTKLLAHPDIVRSLLLIANKLDDEGVQSARATQPALVSLLLSLPGVAQTPPAEGKFMDHVGSGLLGPQWDVLKSLFTLPEEDNWDMRSALHQLPDQAFLVKNKTSAESAMTGLPASLWDETP